MRTPSIVREATNVLLKTRVKSKNHWMLGKGNLSRYPSLGKHEIGTTVYDVSSH
jgi:hypothetical protein